VFLSKEALVLNIYPVVIEFVAGLRPLLAQIERKDRDLGKQLRRAAASVALNLGEGMYSRGELRAARYHTALGSMRECHSCLEVAEAFGYVRALNEVMLERVNRITGTLVRLVEPKR
jgi:four helix bundle protein